MGAALAAKTSEELDPLTEDLPPAATLSYALPSGPPSGAAYLAVMALLVAIWALTGAGYFWPVWPALGWGIGLMAPSVCGRRRLTHP